ncbi:hypothetical protein ZPAH1_orf00402 [Aeromonas phage ZPAH1]|nr:hypothetical protein ZPAH1_orf00402 [Aeromonas phage ZPAH1]
MNELDPTTRDFLAFCSLAFKMQPVEQGIYHKGFVKYGHIGITREVSTQIFCAFIRALRKTDRYKVYIDERNKVRAYYDVRHNLHIGYFDDNAKKRYSINLSPAMQEQLNMRQSASGFRWIQRTKRGPKWISK